MSVNKIYMRSGIPFWCKVIIAFIFWIMAFSMFAAVIFVSGFASGLRMLFTSCGKRLHQGAGRVGQGILKRQDMELILEGEEL